MRSPPSPTTPRCRRATKESAAAATTAATAPTRRSLPATGNDPSGIAVGGRTTRVRGARREKRSPRTCCGRGEERDREPPGPPGVADSEPRAEHSDDEAGEHPPGRLDEELGGDLDQGPSAFPGQRRGQGDRRPHPRRPAAAGAPRRAGARGGDPGAGLKIVQDLAARNPGDPDLARSLEAAKFRWRLSQLPKDVQGVASKPELNKGDLSVLLYWLAPQVRNSRPTAGRIATDVLDHPHREEIVRVVNLGLMEVDPTQHRFYPGSPVRRGQALRVVLRTLARFGAGLLRAAAPTAATPAPRLRRAACWPPARGATRRRRSPAPRGWRSSAAA